MKIHETCSLFYREYLYKLTIKNSLANYFREKNLANARNALDSLQSLYDSNNPLYITRGLRKYSVTEEEYIDSVKLYGIFSKTKEDYKLRVQSSFMCIYSNNLNWLKYTAKQLVPSTVISLHKPDDNTLKLLDRDTIIINEDIGFTYKVTFGSRMGQPEFGRWAQANPKQVKIGKICLESVLEGGYVDGLYFYVRDEKTLQLCNLMTSNIKRIDKLVVKPKLDK